HRHSLDRPTRDEPFDRRAQGPYRPRIAAKETKESHAFTYIPVVHEWTLRFDAPHAPALDEPPALLPDQWLHQLPRAASGAGHRELPRVRLHPPPRLTRSPRTGP